jgi:hypothetical protein
MGEHTKAVSGSMQHGGCRRCGGGWGRHCVAWARCVCAANWVLRFTSLTWDQRAYKLSRVRSASILARGE